MSNQKDIEDVLIEITADILKFSFYTSWALIAAPTSWLIKSLRQSPEEKLRQRNSSDSWGEQTTLVSCPHCGELVETDERRCYACGNQL